jgi:hypothetical protein
MDSKVDRYYYMALQIQPLWHFAAYGRAFVRAIATLLIHV